MIRSQTPLIVTGMHRSGTSLIANLVRDAGVAMGVDGQPPNKACTNCSQDVKGHFEDKRFVEFHDDVIRRSGPTEHLLWAPPNTIPVNQEESARARTLIHIRASAQPWGWKDPRTVLFLDLWANLLPDAVFLFIFRRPDLVVESLRRRRDKGLVWSVLPPNSWLGKDGLSFFRYQQALNAWQLYNRRVLNFVEHSAARCSLFELDTFLDDPEHVVGDLNERHGLTLRPIVLNRVFDSRRLKTHAHPRAEKALLNRPDVRELYGQLKTRAHHFTKL